MPKSKRDKTVSLTKTNKKDRSSKKVYIDKVRAAVGECSSVYLLTFDTMRARQFKGIRAQWRDSYLFLGKNKLHQVALGKGPEDELVDGMHQLSKRVVGNCALLVTSRPRAEVEEYFRNFRPKEYVTSGWVADADRTIAKGPYPQFMNGELQVLRNFGLVVEIHDKMVTLIEDFQVCKKGHPVNVSQAKVLEKFEMPLETFRITVDCAVADGSYEELDVDNGVAAMER